MKILYFGTICSEKDFEEIVQKSKIKPSAAPQSFEHLLLQGFCQLEDVQIEANSFPPVPTYPNGYLFFWGRRKQLLSEKLHLSWLPAINIQVIKQIMYFLFAFLITVKWAWNNQQDQKKSILLYSIYPPVACGVLLASKLTNNKANVIVPDLPQLMFSYSQEKGIKAICSPYFIKLAGMVQAEFDGYILLTEYMNNVVNLKQKPYIIVEGIANAKERFAEQKKKGLSKSIMYAGALNEKFGINLLIEGFQCIDDRDAELWLFGSGDMEEKILAYSEQNKKIKFFGRKSKEDILVYERQATLLVNTRSSKDEYTKYSFPSKTIEYMKSGTPLLTTRLPGIPKEYYQYCFTIEDETVQGVRNAIDSVLNLPEKELKWMGESSKEFITQNKNNMVQSRKIFCFLHDI